jgi:hypothetical protein
MYGRVHDRDTHVAIEPIYHGSHGTLPGTARQGRCAPHCVRCRAGEVRLGTACKTWICYAIRAALDEPGSQPALAVGSSLPKKMSIMDIFFV